MTRMAGIHHFHLLVVALLFSHLLCLKAVPVTRTGSLMLGTQVRDAAKSNHMVTPEENLKEHISFERMDLELHDYPGSGANNRHNPRPPQLTKVVSLHN